MRHGQVIAAHGIFAHCSAHYHQAVASAQHLHIATALVVLEANGFGIIIKHLVGIAAQQERVHSLDGTRTLAQMTTDEAVPPGVAHQLHPGHIHLHECAAAPLPRLEQHHTHRTAGRALRLDEGHKTALRLVEQEAHHTTGELVANRGTCGTPVFKVISYAQPALLHIGQSAIAGIVVDELARQPQVATAHTLTAAALAGELIIWRGA